MKEKQSALSHLMVCLLALWAIATAAVFALLDLRDTAFFGWTLAGAVIATCMARPFRASGLLATVLGTIIFLAIQMYRMAVLAGSGVQLIHFAQALPGALCLVVAAALSALVARRLSYAETQLHRDATLIEELTHHDDLTGTLKGVYADKLLSDEIGRARRYKRTLSLLLLSSDDWSDVLRDRGPDGSSDALKAIGEVVKQKVRDVDTVSRYQESRFIAILPETPIAGAQVAAEKLCQAIAARTALEFRCGIAEFPTDAVSKDELIGEADAALKFARSAGVSVASRGLLV